jgi:hypothetical protein
MLGEGRGVNAVVTPIAPDKAALIGKYDKSEIRQNRTLKSQLKE